MWGAETEIRPQFNARRITFQIGKSTLHYFVYSFRTIRLFPMYLRSVDTYSEDARAVVKNTFQAGHRLIPIQNCAVRPYGLEWHPGVS